MPIDKLTVDDGNGRQVPITSLPLHAADLPTEASGGIKAEHMVRVEWIKTVPLAQAVREKGFFGNTNSAAGPRSKKWVHTIKRL